MMSGGDSSDSVHSVTDLARLFAKEKMDEQLDEMRFWRQQIGMRDLSTVPVDTRLEPDTIIALTKLFVLEWSNELDHKFYKDLRRNFWLRERGADSCGGYFTLPYLQHEMEAPDAQPILLPSRNWGCIKFFTCL